MNKILSFIHHQVILLRVGLLFLTSLPVGSIKDFQPAWQAQSLRYFSLIGFFIGAMSSAGAWLMWGHFSAGIVILAAMFVAVLLTGGLHEDALADTADGLFGGHTIEHRLTIMHDSRIGTYGVLALFFSLSAKFLFLLNLVWLDFTRLFVLLPVAQTLARASAVGLLYALPYVHLQDGSVKGQAFAHPSRVNLGINLIFSTIIAILFLGPMLGLACLSVLLVVTVITGFYCRAKIGGISGDCLGATIQLVELGCYGVILFLTGAPK